MTRSELVAHAGDPARAADDGEVDGATAGLLPPLGEVPPAVVTCELAAGDPAGELLDRDLLGLGIQGGVHVVADPMRAAQGSEHRAQPRLQAPQLGDERIGLAPRLVGEDVEGRAGKMP